MTHATTLLAPSSGRMLRHFGTATALSHSLGIRGPNEEKNKRHLS